MSLVINHNMMAINTARLLGNNYASLATSTERLSSGLRINSAKDDPAGLAIREIMRSDISTLRQGIRNTADGISLLQTAEGAMAIIDEKLVRMKELAEQASTGTYTTVQREIINSEYQTMAAEIDRIANATNFNGIKLLDGSISQAHNGKGLKIHFGLGNNEAEDYYFVKIGDIRATSQSGLRVGGDAKNDIWGTVGNASSNNAAGCCGGGIPALNKAVSGWVTGDIFSFGYNWDWNENKDENLSKGRYISGAYQAGQSPTLEQLVNSVNKGSQARVRIDFAVNTNSSGNPANLTLGELVGSASNAESAAHRICLNNEVYYFGSAELAGRGIGSAKTLHHLGANSSAVAAHALVSAINNNPNSEFWAKVEEDSYKPGFLSVYVFRKDGGESNVAACDDQLGNIETSATQKSNIQWYNDERDAGNESGVLFNNGGKYWGTLKAVPTGYGTFGVQLAGKDAGSERDLWILNVGAGAGYDLNTDPATGFTGLGFGARMSGAVLAGVNNIYGLDRSSFVELQNADDGDWAGGHLRTQSHAQSALDAVQAAIEAKDKIRASLGAYQNRLENTMSNLEMYAENLQAAESRISDVDIATEMTNFVKNQVLVQAGVSMLSQANSLPQMALSLLNG